MTKKWLNTIVVLLLVVVQFFSALSTGQAQEAQTITVGTGGDCATILAAITAASTGDTVKLLENIDVTSSVTISKTLTFDTNGFNVTRSNASAVNQTVFTVSGGDFIILGTGTITSTDAYSTTGSAIHVYNNGTLTLNGATLSGGYTSVYSESGTTTSADFTMNSGTLTDGIAIVGKLHNTTINGGLITSTGQLSPIEGMNTTGGTITLNGGSIESLNSGEQAIYHPQVGDLIINGGSITGPVGIEIRQGNLTITGDAVINGTTGDAIFMNGAVSTTGSLTANISGGTITSTGGYALRETAAIPSDTTDITITGGKFSGSLGAVSFATTAPEILKLTGGAYNTDPGAFVYDPNTIDFIDPWWYINAADTPAMAVHNTTQGTNFNTIQAAITVADEGDVIEVDAGTYNEALTINKAITLKGAGDDLSIIDGTGLTATPLVSVSNLTSGALASVDLPLWMMMFYRQISTLCQFTTARVLRL